MRPDRPPGRECGGGSRPVTPGSRPTPNPADHLTAEVIHRLADGTVSDQQRAALLDLSRERDIQLRLRLATWREAYQLGNRTGYQAGWRAGFACAVGGYKAAQQEAVRDLDLHLTRWDGLRADFGKPRPGDHPGGPVKWSGGDRR